MSLTIIITAVTKTKLSMTVIKKSTDEVLSHEIIDVNHLTKSVGNYIAYQFGLENKITLTPIKELQPMEE